MPGPRGMGQSRSGLIYLCINASDKSCGGGALLTMRRGKGHRRGKRAAGKSAAEFPRRCCEKQDRIVSSANQDRWSIMAATGWSANPSPTYPSSVGRVRGGLSHHRRRRRRHRRHRRHGRRLPPCTLDRGWSWPAEHWREQDIFLLWLGESLLRGISLCVI